MQQTDNFIIFSVQGGAGKNVLATAVVKAIKKDNPDMNIVVLSGHNDIWLYNPNVYRSYQFGNTPHFYNDYIKDKKNVKILALEPYSTNDYLLKKKHLIEIWCDLCRVPYTKEMPELFFNQREVEVFRNKMIGQDQRPIFAIQTNGGAQTDIKVSWMRDLPINIAQEVVNKFANKYRVVQIRREDQPALMGVDYFQGNIRELALLIRFSEKRLFIDSVSQHIAAALNKPSTVTWVRNTPDMLGYAMHDNIVSKVEDDYNVFFNSVLDPYEIQGNIYQCPFKEDTVLFNPQDIVDSLSAQGVVKAN